MQGLIEVPTSNANEYVPSGIKLAIIVATLLLLLSLVILDRTNSINRKGAAARARIIERQIGMELTEDISEFRNELNNVYKWIGGIYISFVLATGVLGIMILRYGPFIFQVLDLVAIAVSLYALILMIPRASYRAVDWSLNRYSCQAGEQLEIWMTNFTPLTLETLHPDDKLWVLESLIDPNGPSRSNLDCKGSRKVKVRPNESWIWIVETGKTKDLPRLDPGPYRLKVAQRTFERNTWKFLLKGVPRLTKFFDLSKDTTSIKMRYVDGGTAGKTTKFSHIKSGEGEHEIAEPWEAVNRPIIIK